MFIIICAMGKNNEIGKDNKLLWNIPEDLKKFKKLTTGHTILMGRKTFESIGRPLPNRKNIVVSSQYINGIETITLDSESISKLKKMSEKEDIFIIGGGQIYKFFLDNDLVDEMYLSFVDFEDSQADTYFPQINYNKWEEFYNEYNKKFIFTMFKKKIVDK